MNTTPRRSLVGVAGLLLLAGPTKAAGPANPDAELIRLCGEWAALWGLYNKAGDFDYQSGSPEELAIEVERSRLAALADPIFARIETLPCTTLAGAQALAAALLVWDCELQRPTTDGDTLILQLVHGLADMRGAA